jgi:hypothetical protein
MNVPEYCHDGATIFFPSTDQTFFSSLCLSAFSSPSDNIPCLPYGHKVEIMMNYALTIKKHSQHHFHIAPNLPCFLGLGDVFETHCEELAFDSTS